MIVPRQFYILDNEDYKKKTFSGYKKTQVNSSLKKCIIKQELDRACKWGAELDLSNQISNLWEQLIIYACNEINVINPRLPVYLWKRYEEFLKLLDFYDKKTIKNSQESRNRLCDLICVITLSPKKKIPKFKKINEKYLNIEVLKDKMEAKNFSEIEFLLKDDDPIELKIPLNELANYLSLDKKGTGIIEKSFFWLEWLLYYEKLYIKKNGKFNCGCRERKNIDNKYSFDCIWLVWDIILYQTKKRYKKEYYNLLKESIQSLYNLYKVNYKKGKRNKRIIYIKYCLLLLFNCTPKINYNAPIFYKDELRIRACANINKLYIMIDTNRKKSTKEFNNYSFIKDKKNSVSIFSKKKRDPYNEEFNDYMKNVGIKHSIKRQKPELISTKTLKNLQTNKILNYIPTKNQYYNTHNKKTGVKKIKISRNKKKNIKKAYKTLTKLIKKL
tara:strand:+ start:555 stop:1883 length:1329 start_codon:yes stop_codon:yes gene_type:complete